ncbi:MAG: response regulator transcription factor [Gammaproteobacteria bacterium]|nr:response regulator transcription factor [Gammaproteobacteria bacterium]
MIRVFIADDHPVVRAGIKQILAEAQDIELCGEAENGQEVLEKVERCKPHVLILDIAMPGRNGIETLKRITDTHPDIAVIILSMYPEDQYALRLLKSGASGYLTKECASDQLVTAVRKVARGRKYISTALAEILAENISGNGDQPAHQELSNREYQIFCLLAGGRRVSEIAGELSLSVKTISTYRTRILRKMHMTKNAELTYYAIKNNLVD